MNTTHADVAFFTPAVKPMLHRFDSSNDHRPARTDSVKTQLGCVETKFIVGLDSFYVAATGEDHWPYTQRHNGPKGFLRVVDASTLGFVTSVSSRRYISPGDALLFLIDHDLKARLKIWADAEVSEDPATMEKLVITRRSSPAEHVAFLFRVRGFGWGNEQHAMQRSATGVYNIETARSGKSDPLSTSAMAAKCCLSFDASSEVWTLNAHRIAVADMSVDASRNH